VRASAFDKSCPKNFIPSPAKTIGAVPNEKWSRRFLKIGENAHINYGDTTS
jgi:hypothetical protein